MTVMRRTFNLILLAVALIGMAALPQQEVSAANRNVIYIIRMEDMITVGTAGFWNVILPGRRGRCTGGDCPYEYPPRGSG